MPIFRYFVFVGGALLAIIFGVNLVFPQTERVETVAAATPMSDVPMIRIRSDRKLPERVVLDTSQAVLAPPVKTADAIAQQPAQTAKSEALADLASSPRVRETFAQVAPEARVEPAAARKVEAKPHVAQATTRRKVARSRSIQPQYYGPQYYGPQYGRPMMVAQQPHFGLFNNTW